MMPLDKSATWWEAYTMTTNTHKRCTDAATGISGTVHWTHAGGWFTPDDGERDELGRVIPTMLDEDMNLVPECEAEVCGGTGNHDGQPVDCCDECRDGEWIAGEWTPTDA